MQKTLFITGGGGELGAAIIEKFVAHNYEIIAPRSSVLNLEDLDSIDSYVGSIPNIAAFIHCAGINIPKSLDEIELNDIVRTCNINAFSFYKIVSALIRKNKLYNSGHILAISSIYGTISRRGRFSYTASKACLEGMVKNCALELGMKQIKVNALAPGFIDTSLTKKNNSPELIADLIKDIPLGCMAKTQDIAEVAYFLASAHNQYINGQTIIADGGYLAGGFQV